MSERPLDEARLQLYMGKMVGDLGAAIDAPLVLLGDRLGLYRALHEGGAQNADALAQRAGIRARYAREWLAAQAAAGYVDYEDASGCFSLNPEQAAVFADETSPVFMQGAFEIIASLFSDIGKVERAFRNGSGLGWHEHHACLFSGTERFFRPGYNANLTRHWLPALDGIVKKLEHSARVADVGCGHGASTIVMARAYPRSHFDGYDYHAASIAAARSRAQAASLNGHVHFERAGAKDFPGRDYDLVTFFDCLHDIGDPVGAARHVRESLASDGTWMIVEPMAGDSLQDNLNPVGRIYYAASAMICTPCSLAQDVGLGLGAQAGEKRLREVVLEGGFGSFRRVAETPFNLVFEARP